MNSYQAPNRAENITIADASALLATFAKLGLYFGPMHANETIGGGNAANFVPLDELALPEVELREPLNLQSFGGSDWHNIAMLKQTWGNGGTEAFKRVYNMLRPGADASAAILSIPGVGAAVDKLIKKA
jgi:hypothetical protein